ncbi:MAG: diguanylate cyclase [Pseudomonadales bacterium]
MDDFFLIAVIGCLAAGYAMLHLWRHRDIAGAPACMAMFATAALYVVATLRTEPTLLSVRLALIGIALTPPLLFVAVVEYANIHLPRWPLLRIACVGVPLLAAIVTLSGDASQALLALASEPDRSARVAQTLALRQGPLALTTYLSYGFTLGTLSIAAWRMRTAPSQRAEMAAIIALPCLVTLADYAYYSRGFVLFGIMPTPLVMTLGLVALSLVLYRSALFDLRPVARSVLMDTMQDPMLVLDHRQRIVDCNRAACDWLERPQRDVVGKALAEVLPTEMLGPLDTTSHSRTETRIASDEEEQWYEVDVSLIATHGGPSGRLLVIRDITERKVVQEALHLSRRALEEANARLVEQSLTDPLTGLKNRRFLFERLQEEVNRHRRSGTVLGLLLIDVDEFKTINDTHGHPAGDGTLQAVAEAIRRVIRQNDVPARIGGDEFAIIAVDTEPAGTEHLAERLRLAIAGSTTTSHAGETVTLTASIGVAYFQGGNADAERLFSEADLRLYDAKNQGRNRVVCGPRPDDPRAAAS